MLNANGDNKQAGNITLQAQNDIKVVPANSITARSSGGSGGDITLSTVNGNINIGSVDTSGILLGGKINIASTKGDITTDLLQSSYNLTTNKAGTVNLTGGGNLTTNGIQSSALENGGVITLSGEKSINLRGGVLSDSLKGVSGNIQHFSG